MAVYSSLKYIRVIKSFIFHEGKDFIFHEIKQTIFDENIRTGAIKQIIFQEFL